MRSTNPLIVFLCSPVLWGGLVCAGFYALLLGGVVESAFMTRYFTESSIEYVETAMFFIGLFALLFKIGDIRFQRRWIQRQETSPDPFFPAVPRGGNVPQDAVGMREKIRQLPNRFQSGSFFRRMSDALDFVIRNDSADGFEDEMKYLADMDASRMANGYSFVRVIIWAIPILGFLGTVMGITLAIGALGGNLSDTENTLPKMIAGLSVAFDTTALALAFSIVLMFLQFFAERSETALQDRVDMQVHRELFGRFTSIANTPEGLVVAVRTMGESILKGFQQYTQNQVALWEQGFQRVDTEWTQRLESLGGRLVSAYQTAFETAGGQLASRLADTLEPLISQALAKTLDDNLRQQWTTHIAEIKDVEKILTEQTVALRDALAQNAKFITHSSDWVTAASTQMQSVMEQLRQIVISLQNLGKMENVLSENLSTLQGAKNFERTVAELSAATAMLADWLQEVRTRTAK